MSSLLIGLISIFLFRSHVRLGLEDGYFRSRFPTKNMFALLVSLLQHYFHLSITPKFRCSNTRIIFMYNEFLSLDIVLKWVSVTCWHFSEHPLLFPGSKKDQLSKQHKTKCKNCFTVDHFKITDLPLAVFLDKSSFSLYLVLSPPLFFYQILPLFILTPFLLSLYGLCLISAVILTFRSSISISPYSPCPHKIYHSFRFYIPCCLCWWILRYLFFSLNLSLIFLYFYSSQLF